MVRLQLHHVVVLGRHEQITRPQKQSHHALPTPLSPGLRRGGSHEVSKIDLGLGLALRTRKENHPVSCNDENQQPPRHKARLFQECVCLLQ